MATTTSVHKSDTQIRKDVENELQWDTRLLTTSIGVAVTNGIVTLNGTVDSWAKREAAQVAAHRVVGVLDVANELQVRLPGTAGRTDAEIAQAVRLALQWDVFVPDERIRSTVSKGIVTLDGDVEDLTQRDDVARAVRNLAGVTAVVNQIVVLPSKRAQEIRKSIEQALERRTKREVQDLRLTVQDGTVSVSGVVDSWTEKQAVLGAIRGTRGVQDVDDHLTLGF